MEFWSEENGLSGRGIQAQEVVYFLPTAVYCIHMLRAVIRTKRREDSGHEYVLQSTLLFEDPMLEDSLSKIDRLVSSGRSFELVSVEVLASKQNEEIL